MSLSSWRNWLSAFVTTCRSCQSCLFVNRTTTQTTQLKVLHWVLVRRILSKPIVLKTTTSAHTSGLEFQGCVWCYTMRVKVIQFSSVHQCVLKSWIPGNTGLLATANRELRWMNGVDGCQLDTIGLYDKSFHFEARLSICQRLLLLPVSLWKWMF